MLTKISYDDETRDHITMIPGAVSSLMRMLTKGPETIHASNAKSTGAIIEQSSPYGFC